MKDSALHDDRVTIAKKTAKLDLREMDGLVYISQLSF